MNKNTRLEGVRKGPLQLVRYQDLPVVRAIHLPDEATGVTRNRQRNRASRHESSRTVRTVVKRLQVNSTPYYRK